MDVLRHAAAALVLGLVSVASPATACAMPTVYIDDLVVTFQPDRTTYRRGETVTVRIAARRRDPVPASAAAVPAEIDLRLRTPGGGELGRIVFTLPDSGARTGRWRIPGGVPVGPVNVTVVALHQLVPSTECYGSLVYERGTAARQRYLTIKR